MLESLTIGDIYKSLKAQVEASQKLYQTVLDLADIADRGKENLDDMSKQKLEQVMQNLLNVGDALSESADETTKRVQKSMAP